MNNTDLEKKLDEEFPVVPKDAYDECWCCSERLDAGTFYVDVFVKADMKMPDGSLEEGYSQIQNRYCIRCALKEKIIIAESVIANMFAGEML